MEADRKVGFCVNGAERGTNCVTRRSGMCEATAHRLPICGAREAEKSRDCVLQRTGYEVSVSHGHVDGRVTEKVLHDWKRDASGDKVCRERVSQRVDAEGAHAGPPGDAPKRLLA